MKAVRTILGDIDPKDMKATNCHDHLIRTGGLEVLHDSDFLMDDVDKAVEEAQRFADAGGNTLVDMGAVSLGRDIGKLLDVANRVDINIIAATGFHMAQFYDTRIHWVTKYTVNQVADLLIADVMEGIDIYDYMGPIVERSNAKAGVIKVATSYGCIKPFEQKTLQAVAIAQQETGALISTHTQFGTMALEQIQALTKYGADPERVVLGHVQRNPDPWYHKKLVSTGATLMYDGAYRIKYWPDSQRVELIRAMVEAGYQKHLLLGVDAGRSSYQKAYGGGVGIDYDLSVFMPRMRDEGIPEDAVQDIFVNNPARLFAIEVKGA